MKEQIKNFIEENIKLIESNTVQDWKTLYQKFEDEYDEVLAGNVSAVLLEAGIDPCEVLGEVPRRFLQFQEQITSYIIPKNCTYIGMSAFEDTRITHIHIPDSVVGLDYLCFSATPLKSIVLPDSVKRIENAAFLACIDLSEIDLGHNLVYIGDDVFSSCSSLVRIVIPNTLKYINLDWFSDCKKLESLDYRGTTEEFSILVGTELEKFQQRFQIICVDGIL